MQKVIPAILSVDPADLRAKLELLKGHTNWIHLDIMDGKFVPNTSVSLFELGEAYQFFNIEIHLMVSDPREYFKDCDEVGAKRVIFHYEAASNIQEVLEKAKHHQFHIGIALNPETPAERITPHIQDIDSILLLSVNPGFQGQEFIPDVLKKIPEIRRLKQDILIGLDGGINAENIKGVFEAGVDYAGVGSAAMKSADPVVALRHLEEILK